MTNETHANITGQLIIRINNLEKAVSKLQSKTLCLTRLSGDLIKAIECSEFTNGLSTERSAHLLEALNEIKKIENVTNNR